MGLAPSFTALSTYRAPRADALLSCTSAQRPLPGVAPGAQLPPTVRAGKPPGHEIGLDLVFVSVYDADHGCLGICEEGPSRVLG